MERDLWRWDAVGLAAAVRTRRISSREATRAVLDRLAAVNPALNAVTVLLADQALAAADRADAAVRRGDARDGKRSGRLDPLSGLLLRRRGYPSAAGPRARLQRDGGRRADARHA